MTRFNVENRVWSSKLAYRSRTNRDTNRRTLMTFIGWFRGIESKNAFSCWEKFEKVFAFTTSATFIGAHRPSISYANPLERWILFCLVSLVRPPARLYLFWKFKITILKEISSNYIFSEKKKYIYPVYSRSFRRIRRKWDTW